MYVQYNFHRISKETCLWTVWVAFPSSVSWDKVCRALFLSFVPGYVTLNAVHCTCSWSLAEFSQKHSQSSNRFPELVLKRWRGGGAVRVDPGLCEGESFTGKALQTSCGTPWPRHWEDGHSYGSASPGSAPGGRTPTCTHDRRRLREEEMKQKESFNQALPFLSFESCS